MRFDQFAIAVLILRPDAPQLGDDDAAALPDAHLAHLADLHRDGFLLAAGPLLGGPDIAFRGLCILNTGPDRARQAQDDG